MKLPLSPRLFATVAALAVGCSAPQTPLSAQTSGGFADYTVQLIARARSEGVSEETIRRVSNQLVFSPRVIELDRSQPGVSPVSPPFGPYLRTHVDSARISMGHRQYEELMPLLTRIEGQYGVPGKILLAIWGHETNYGRFTGSFDLPSSLATLAYDGRRRELFAGEFISVLKMVDQGVPLYRLKGSWAGAFGNPQFLPSVYLRLAADADGDGFRDIWSSRADTLASIANYFRDAGWRAGEPWGVRASVPAAFDRASVAPRLNPVSCNRVHARHSQWKTVGEWRAMGVTPMAPITDSTLAALFEPDGPGTGAYLLTGNYRVILQYNCSNYYALSVGLLADELAR